MAYPDASKVGKLVEQLKLYAQLKHEYGARNVEAVVRRAERALQGAVRDLRRLPDDPRLARCEPDGLAAIRRLRPAGPRRLWTRFDERKYCDRLHGALLGRFAGCTLGAPVEGWSVWNMQKLAEENGEPFPPTDYWKNVPNGLHPRYDTSLRRDYTRDRIRGVPVDDDVTYTLLGLLIAEDFGPRFTTADVGKAWVRYLPMACTAEHVALENLKAGVPAAQAGVRENPYVEWIGADIRADPWGYLAPGWPERAAEMAYRDAYLSHRRTGIYGEMYFAAAIAAAFAVDDPVEALRIGLTEIPAQCRLAREVRWALRAAPRIRNYRQARKAVDKRYAGMHHVHTINNACLTIWGLTIGGRDFTRAIGETVAMGLDNDCTAATAGSIAGAVSGRKGIPLRWHRNFRNIVRTYLIGRKTFRISRVVERFARQARRICRNTSGAIGKT
jgi:ADP-ribosylglycohydrolase